MKADNASLKSPWAYCAQHDQTNAPVYRYGRIRSIKSLELALGMPEQALRALAKRASSMYFVAKRVPKEDGAQRVLFDTRQPLKKILQRVNSQFLKRVYYPPYLTGGVPGKDYTWSTKLHANAPLVIKEDIRKFFPSVSTEVVFDIWHRFFGFSLDVAELLTLLTTRNGHLEQGSPTSGYLANLALWDVEPRTVSLLVQKCGITRYSRHVDDICMSSTSMISAAQMTQAISLVYGMLANKGLSPNRAKHIAMHAGEPIRILKLVANRKPSLHKSEQSRVRAAVHGFCLRAANLDKPDLLRAELPKIRGLAYKLRRFHPQRAAPLLARIDTIARALESLDSSMLSSTALSTDNFQPLAVACDTTPWD